MQDLSFLNIDREFKRCRRSGEPVKYRLQINLRMYRQCIESPEYTVVLP